MQLSKLFELSIIKTVLFNAHYFGIGGVIHPRVFVAKNFLVKSLDGILEISPGNRVYLGFRNAGIVDIKTQRGIWENRGKIVFGGSAVIGSGTKISCSKNANITFGSDAMIIANSQLVSRIGITLGEGVLISWECLIMDSDFHTIRNKDNEKKNNDKEIIIGDKVWIGCRCTILKGTVIPRGSVIGACSLLSSTLDSENAIYINGGKKIKTSISWEH